MNTLPADHISYQELESFLSGLLDLQYIILFDSDTAAWMAAISLVDESCDILTSANAPIPLFNAIDRSNKRACYYDLRLDGTVETRLLERTKSEKSRLFIATHNHGLHSDLESIAAFCRSHDLLMIEDASQLLYSDRNTSGEVVCYNLAPLFSSPGTKGAFLATDDPGTAQRLKAYASGGLIPTKLWNYDLVNSRDNTSLTPLIASHALEGSKSFSSDLGHIKTLQEHYLRRLSSNRLITLPKKKDLTPYPLFPIFLIPALFCPKEDIYQALLDAGIPVSVGNKPIYKTTLFLDDKRSLFGAEELFKSQLLLPCHAEMDEKDVDYVIEVVEKVLKQYGYRGCSF